MAEAIRFHIEHTEAAAVVIIVHDIFHQESLAVILDFQEREVILQALDFYPNLFCIGMFAGVVNSFLCDGENHGLAVHVQLFDKRIITFDDYILPEGFLGSFRHCS